jgi:hypothetical protein
MKIEIKDLAVRMEVKNKGVEFEVYDNDDKFLGDLVVSKAWLVWCPGKTGVDNGHHIKWSDFIEFMKTRPND